MSDPIRACEGFRSESDRARPAPICRDCKCRHKWLAGERDNQQRPAATFAGRALLRLSCPNKVR